MQALNVIRYSVIISATLAAPFWYWWNNALVKFITIAPQVTLWDCALLLLGAQVIPFFLLRKVEVRYFPQPIYLPPATQEEIEAQAKENK